MSFLNHDRPDGDRKWGSAVIVLVVVVFFGLLMAALGDGSVHVVALVSLIFGVPALIWSAGYAWTIRRMNRAGVADQPRTALALLLFVGIGVGLNVLSVLRGGPGLLIHCNILFMIAAGFLMLHAVPTWRKRERSRFHRWVGGLGIGVGAIPTGLLMFIVGWMVLYGLGLVD